MISAYNRYLEGHKDLFRATNEKELFAATHQVVENYLDNRAIWLELEYYKKNKVVLGKHPAFYRTERIAEIKQMTTAELVKLRDSLTNNMARTKKLVKDNPNNKNNIGRNQRLEDWAIEIKEVNRILGINA
jgi:hypothetical protein